MQVEAHWPRLGSHVSHGPQVTAAQTPFAQVWQGPHGRHRPRLGSHVSQAPQVIGVQLPLVGSQVAQAPHLAG